MRNTMIVMANDVNDMQDCGKLCQWHQREILKKIFILQCTCLFIMKPEGWCRFPRARTSCCIVLAWAKRSGFLSLSSRWRPARTRPRTAYQCMPTWLYGSWRCRGHPKNCNGQKRHHNPASMNKGLASDGPVDLLCSQASKVFDTGAKPPL